MQKKRDQLDTGVDYYLFLAVDRWRRDIPAAAAHAPDPGHALDPAFPLAPGCSGPVAGEGNTAQLAAMGDREYNNHAVGFHGLHARCAGCLARVEAAVFSYRLDALVHRLEPGFPPLIK